MQTETEAEPAATIKRPGLIAMFQAFVITSTLIGLFLYGWRYLPIPLSSTTVDILAIGGEFAIAPNVSALAFLLLQPVWILCAVGLCFFRWWARPLFVGTYVISTAANLIGGIVVMLPWELTLVAAATLLDGAVFALAFLPPLSGHFARRT